MRYVGIQLAVLAGTIGAVAALARGAVAARWGAGGLDSLWVALTISAIPALMVIVPVGLAVVYWPRYAPQVAFGGTVVRLLGTGVLALGYQAWAAPHLASFLACLLVAYLALLLAETICIVLIVARAVRNSAPQVK